MPAEAPAGKHSWSDVAAGLALGHVVGALVAIAHPMIPVAPGDLREWTPGQGGFGLTWSDTY